MSIEVTRRDSCGLQSLRNGAGVGAKGDVACISFDALTSGDTDRVQVAMAACLSDARCLLEKSNLLAKSQLYVVVFARSGPDNNVMRYKRVWGSLSDSSRQLLEGKSVGEGEIPGPLGEIRYFALCKVEHEDLLALTQGRESVFFAFWAPRARKCATIMRELEEAIAEDVRKYSTERWEATLEKGVEAGYLVVTPSFFEELHSVGVDVFYNPILYKLD